MIVIFKPTLNCNIKCEHCYVGRQRYSNVHITVQQSREIFSKLPAKSEIILHGGEPTIMGVDYFKESLEGFSELFKFSMQTNLTLIDHEWVKFIKEYLKGRVSTSFDYFSSLRPIDNDLWLDRIALLKSSGITPYVVGMLWQGNQHKGVEAYEFFNSLNLSFRLNAIENIGFAADKFFTLRHGYVQYARAVNAIFDKWFMSSNADILVDPCAEFLGFLLLGNSFRKCPFTSKCGAHFMSVYPNGDVYPCGGFEDCGNFKYGNLLDDSLQQVLSSVNRKDAIKRSSCLPEKCVQCSYYAVCNGGCRLEAYSFYGDIYKETSLCEDYKSIFSHIEKRLNSENGDVPDWWFSLKEKRGALNAV